MVGPNATLASPSTEVQAARRGDRDAFGRLMSAHTGLVRTVVLDHVRTADDVADCIQETFAKALRSIPQLEDPERFTAWLSSIARHVAIDHRRRRVRDLALLTHSAEPTENLTCRRPSPESVVTRRQLDDSLRARIDDLPKREATAVSLASLHDRSPSEIARDLGVSEGNAKIIVHRGRRRLRGAILADAHDNRQLSCTELDKVEEPEARDHLASCQECHAQALALLRSSE